MKRILALLLAMVMSLTLLAGCGSTQSDEPVSDVKAVTVEKASFPLTIEDQLGNSVTLEKPAERIVSGYYISSSACIALGLENKLVGTEEKTDKRPIYKLAAPELIGSIANVGSAKAFDLESCLGAEPDLVILPKKAKDYAKTLNEMGIAAVVVNPESHEALVDMIKLIANLTGSEETAGKLITSYNEVLSKVESTTANLDDSKKPVVYMCNTSTYLATAPKDMYQASLVRSAGGKNAGDILEGDSWTDVSYEQILTMNPDIIIIPTNNMANGQPDFTAADVLADANLAEVTAVKNGAVYNMPAGLEAWDSPVPSGVLGMLWLLATVHPDLYTKAECADYAASFYKTFYGFDMDKSIITG